MFFHVFSIVLQSSSAEFVQNTIISFSMYMICFQCCFQQFQVAISSQQFQVISHHKAVKKNAYMCAYHKLMRSMFYH